MTSAHLAPMREGGQWILLPEHDEPVYAVHSSHINRLLTEEKGQIVMDPRLALLAQRAYETEETIQQEPLDVSPSKSPRRK